MTPAELLLAAADLLDKRASEATEGPWKLTTRSNGGILGIEGRNSWDEVITTGSPECMSHCYGGSSVIEATDADWRYIATMDPEKGRFLVEWLREEAAEARIYKGANPEHLFRHALGFADLLLAGAS